MSEKKSSNQVKDITREDFWGKYVEIRLKEGRVVRGLVITQAGDALSISDEFKNLEEYQNYKPQIMGTCGIVYPHMEGYAWNEIETVEILAETKD